MLFVYELWVHVMLLRPVKVPYNVVDRVSTS
jgi:hypothetical protein